MRRLSYFDLAGRATGSFDRADLARAIERLSRAYRQGRSVDHDRSAVHRAAYLVHVLPAHVCDERRLFLEELPDVLARPEVTALALGGGPGTEALALAESAAQLSARGERQVERIVVRRVDRVAAWDEAFRSVEGPFREALVAIDPDFGSSFTLEAPPTLLAADLARPPLPAELLEAARGATLVIAANLVTELEPRGEPRPPAGFLENLAALAGAGPAGQDLVILDRALAPGALDRIGASLEAIAAARPGARVVGPFTRETRCACALTRAVKALYGQVRLETTKVEDRPILNTRTAWARVTLP